MSEKTKPEQAWLKGAGDLAAYLGVTPRTVAKWVQEGLPVKRLSERLYLSKPEQVDAWIEERAKAVAMETRQGTR